jgi:Tol biopolymer transport system component
LVLDLGYGNTPSWSPDDRQIAYMINSSNPIQARGGIWIMNADGTKRRWIAEGWYCRWSPDGKRLCCHGPLGDGRSTLFVVDLATKRERPLLTAEGWSLQNYGGTWSPDGKRVVFVGSYQGNDCLATIGLNGPNDAIRILYTNDDSSQRLVGPPAWSPDGRQIVFAMQPASVEGPRQWWKSYLYSMAADVPCAPVLLEGTKVGNINRGMNWSRDSKKVIFSSER